jgi:iron-sulfur cluster repair protein YtfE (RIC family)
MIPPGPDSRLLPPHFLAPLDSASGAFGQRRVAPRSSRSAHSSAQTEQPDWNSYTCEFLITRILRRQHAELRDELHQLEDMAAAADAGKPSHPHTPGRVQSALVALAGKLDTDFVEEERLYSRLLEVELAYIGTDCASCPPQRVQSSLHNTAQRHGVEKRRLGRIEAAIRSFNPAPAAGSVDHILWNRLLRFHQLLMAHFHIEDYVLLPRVTRMEAELFG